MITNNISFKGAIQVQGNMNHLDDFYKELKKVPQLKTNDSVDMIIHKNPFTKTSTFVIATGDNDAHSLYNFRQTLGYFIQTKRKKIRHLPLSPEELEKKIIIAQEAFFQAFISKYIQLPEEIYDLKDILNAIKEEKFDLLNLKFK